jgi:predicted nucleic acid-binding protein
MTKLLLDTNTLNYLAKGLRPALDYYEDAIEKRATFLLCPVTQYELTRYFELRGMSRLLRNYEEIAASWQLCDLSFDDWKEAAHLWAERHRIGRSITDMDLLIVVLALREGAVLVTSNVSHFQGFGLDLQDWMAPSGSH